MEEKQLYCEKCFRKLPRAHYVFTARLSYDDISSDAWEVQMCNACAKKMLRGFTEKYEKEIKENGTRTKHEEKFEKRA